MDESMKNDVLNPFDQFLKNPELDMLNAALPYVSSQMRTPLALYIKSAEMRRILSDFDSEEILSACGFNHSSNDPEAMLKAMKMAGGKNANYQIDQLLNMMNFLKAYQSLNEIIQNNPEMISFLTNMLKQPQTSSNETTDMMAILSQMMKKS